MQAVSRDQLDELTRLAQIKSRLRRELKFVPAEVSDWEDRELLAVADRTGAKGVMIMQLHDEQFVVAYELSTKTADKSTGRSRSVICDFCYTWQRGDNTGRITFARKADGHTLSFLCCADLKCSLHVRNKTSRAVMSRAQLPEDITTVQRIQRLRTRLQELVDQLALEPVA